MLSMPSKKSLSRTIRLRCVQLLGKLIENPAGVGLLQPGNLLQLMGDDFPLRRGIAGLDVMFEIAVEDRQADRVLLLDRHVRQRRGHGGGMIVLGPGVFSVADRAESHRFAGIDDDEQMQICLFQILLEIDLVGLAEDLPVDVAGVVAGHVGPMLRELDGDSLVWRAMHPGHQSFDDEPGPQVQGMDAHSVRGSRYLR